MLRRILEVLGCQAVNSYQGESFEDDEDEDVEISDVEDNQNGQQIKLLADNPCSSQENKHPEEQNHISGKQKGSRRSKKGQKRKRITNQSDDTIVETQQNKDAQANQRYSLRERRGKKIVDSEDEAIGSKYNRQKHRRHSEGVVVEVSYNEQDFEIGSKRCSKRNRIKNVREDFEYQYSQNYVHETDEESQEDSRQPQNYKIQTRRSSRNVQINRRGEDNVARSSRRSARLQEQ
eukprot:TRINITY_DN12326_c0_g1_i1.p2 TRINITY_DN12326_c0_g1~~TRINITY_DN12326_c0_g1_i1.p2  ORF type:complete len:234 (-),score=24.39 TRINITY_DN12326_c0_g1_i1:231-932(-)